MYRFLKNWKLFFLSCLFIFLLNCSKISQDNYNKITTGMTMREVISLLGEPTSSENINIGGISGISAIWKDKTTEIDIQFLNDKVLVKSYSKIDINELKTANSA